MEFVPGVSYRNLLIWRGAKLACAVHDRHAHPPPHDLTDQSVLEDYPRGPGSDVLCDLMAAASTCFATIR